MRGRVLQEALGAGIGQRLAPIWCGRIVLRSRPSRAGRNLFDPILYTGCSAVCPGDEKQRRLKLSTSNLGCTYHRTHPTEPDEDSVGSGHRKLKVVSARAFLLAGKDLMLFANNVNVILRGSPVRTLE